MSNRVLFVNYGYIKNNAPLKNGLGRYIPQLMRMTIKFDKEQAASQGVRDFIETDLVEFAKKNPHVAIYLKPRRQRSPVLVTEYLNGERNWQSLFFKKLEDIRSYIDLARTSSGKEYQVQFKYEFTENPSIQGMWNPFTNIDPELATAKFPLGPEWESRDPTATDRLKILFENQKKMNSIKSSEERETLVAHRQGEDKS